jgi:hypothetical protein
MSIQTASNEVRKLTKRLHKVVGVKLANSKAPEPPRLVRANSAFEKR